MSTASAGPIRCFRQIEFRSSESGDARERHLNPLLPITVGRVALIAALLQPGRQLIDGFPGGRRGRLLQAFPFPPDLASGRTSQIAPAAPRSNRVCPGRSQQPYISAGFKHRFSGTVNVSIPAERLNGLSGVEVLGIAVSVGGRPDLTSLLTELGTRRRAAAARPWRGLPIQRCNWTSRRRTEVVRLIAGDYNPSAKPSSREAAP